MNVEKCRGSFMAGTACGDCRRCAENWYGPEQKAISEQAEAQRLATFPASRVKPQNPATVIKVDVNVPEAEVEVTQS